MKCIICNKEFEGRKDAKCCSSTCRSKASRATDNGLSVADVTDKLSVATDKPVSVTKPIRLDSVGVPTQKGWDGTYDVDSRGYRMCKHKECPYTIKNHGSDTCLKHA